MLKNRFCINESEDSNGYTIYFSCLGLNNDCYIKIKDVIKHFVPGDELFFGHYRTDGINLSNEEFLRYGLEIPEYFRSNGKYEKIIKGNEKKFLFLRSMPLELTVSCAPVNDETYSMLDKIFHYYLETIVFCPKIDWETFVNEYGNYMSNAAKDYVAKGYTDFLFSYFDSGDFSITFDPKVHDPHSIKNEVFDIFK